MVCAWLELWHSQVGSFVWLGRYPHPYPRHLGQRHLDLKSDNTCKVLANDQAALSMLLSRSSPWQLKCLSQPLYYFLRQCFSYYRLHVAMCLLTLVGLAFSIYASSASSLLNDWMSNEYSALLCMQGNLPLIFFFKCQQHPVFPGGLSSK